MNFHPASVKLTVSPYVNKTKKITLNLLFLLISLVKDEVDQEKYV
jgi:hypothetical protein